MESHWASSHRGLVSPDGRPAPSTAKQHLSHLSTAFQCLGRRGPYSSSPPSGNPCDSEVVSGYRSGYTAGACDAGYEELSAVPMSSAKYQALVRHIRQCAAGAPDSTQRAMFLRDLCCFHLMWHTTIRGGNCGELKTTDFSTPFPPPAPPAGGAYPPGQQVVISKLGTKTYRYRRAPPQAVPPHPDPVLCPVRALRDYWSACQDPNAPPANSITSFLFRPLHPSLTYFKPVPLSSGTLQDRLVVYLKAMREYNGESCHSFRRGALQGAQAAGASDKELHDLGQIRTPAILHRYLDTQRHQGIKRTRFVSAPSGQ